MRLMRKIRIEVAKIINIVSFLQLACIAGNHDSCQNINKSDQRSPENAVGGFTRLNFVPDGKQDNLR